MIKSFNHFTVNTGHSRISCPSDVFKDMIPTLQDYIDQLKKQRYVEILDGIKAELRAIGDSSYMIALYTEAYDDLLPILYSFGCSNEKDTEGVLKEIERIYAVLREGKPELNLKAPFVADVITPSSFLSPSAFKWTGDFARCMGWALMDMESIEKFGNEE